MAGFGAPCICSRLLVSSLLASPSMLCASVMALVWTPMVLSVDIPSLGDVYCCAVATTTWFSSFVDFISSGVSYILLFYEVSPLTATVQLFSFAV